MKITIKEMDFTDLLQIKNDLSSFDDFWNFNILESEFKNPNSTYFIAKIYTNIVGFAGVLKTPDSMEIMNIVTKISNRHCGVGSKLLEKLIDFSKHSQSPCLTLEVRENNNYAIKLYEKYNFKKVGLRKNYYEQNENAIIMTLYFE